jgi:Ca-activated chloride channel homolog
MFEWRQTAVAIGVLASAQVMVTAQQPTFRATTELVNINVSVVSSNTKPAVGLSESQFEVFENGVRQAVTFFASGDLPIDVVLLLDTSESMAQSMPLVRRAASRFVSTLRTADRAAVMGISGGLRVHRGLSGDKEALTQAIEATRPGGRTPLYASIYTALRELEKARRTQETPRRQALVVLSDGQDTASGFGFNELLDCVRRHAVPVYAIAPRPPAKVRVLHERIFGQSTSQQDFELRKLALETGGRAFFPVALEELSGVYGDIASELAHQYSIGYQSTNPAHDGAFRRIALKVAAPGVTWRARTGYIAEGRGGV